MPKKCLLPVLLFVSLIFACDSGPEEEPAPDVSHIQVDLELERFERDLALAAWDSTHNGAQVLRERYPVFFDSVWLYLMLPEQRPGVDSALVRAFAKTPQLRFVLDSVEAAFGPGSDSIWQQDLEQAFRYAKYYFPEQALPRIVTYVSEFTLGGLTYGEEILGIGLDFYLGSGFPAYEANPEAFPRYIQRSMNRDHIAARAVETWLSGIMGKAAGEQMLDQMIHNGKLLYLKSKLLPHVSDTAVLGFSESHLDWLRNNEEPMWAHYLDENLLYETKLSRISKHIGPAPTAPGMPPESPGGGANWVGMNIVRQYMQRHPQTSLQELLELKDAQSFLKASRYRPGR